MFHNRTVRHTVEILGLVGAYVVSGALGLRMDAVSGFATLVWPPTGFVLAALVLRGLHLWPGVLIGATIVNLFVGAPPAAVALGIGIGNTLEGVFAAFILTRVVQFRPSLVRVRDVLMLVSVAAIMSTLISASIGVLSLWMGGLVRPEQLWETWTSWWLGDAIGDLVIAPFLLTWGTLRTFRFRASLHALANVALGGAVVGVALVVFMGGPDRGTLAYPYVLFPVLITVALRGGPRGAALATLVTSAIAVWGTSLGLSPFVRESLSHSLFFLQSFMTVAAVTIAVLAAAVSERRDAIDAREQVLAVVPHELRNPLAALVLQADHLLHLSDAELGPNVRVRIEGIHRSARAVELLITNLLDAAMIRSGTLSLAMKQEDLSIIVNEVADLIRPLATQKQQLLNVDVPPTLPLRCDRGRLTQVITNLLGNAVKFTPKGGEIHLSVQAADGRVRCAIRDNGPGIEGEHLRHVFEPYWKTGPGAGTGLGLSIAQGIVEEHGGKLWLESSLGVGTTAWFSLPVDPTPT